MKSEIFKIIKTIVALQFIFATSAVYALDDDFIKLQEQQFKLQRQLMDQQYKMQRQQFQLERQLVDQQFKLQRQLMDQQFQMQRQLWRLESYNRNLSSYSPPSHWHVGASSFDPMINLRSQIRMQDYNINSLTNISNRDLIKLQNQQFRIQQPMRQTFKDQQQLSKIMNTSSNYVTQSFLRRNEQFGSGIQSFNVNSSLPSLAQMRQYDNYWSTGQYWTNDPYYADLARPAPDLTPENYMKAFGFTAGVIATDWARFGIDVAPGVNPWARFGLQRLSEGVRNFMMNEIGEVDPGGDLTGPLNQAAQPSRTAGTIFGIGRDLRNLARNVHIQPYKKITIDQVSVRTRITLLTPERVYIAGFDDNYLKVAIKSGNSIVLGRPIAGVALRNLMKGPSDSYMHQMGKSLSDSLGRSNMTIKFPTGTFETNRNFGNVNNNWDYSYGSNSLISQPTLNNNFGGYSNFQIYQPTNLNTNFGSYGNNFQISQPQFNNSFGGYSNYPQVDFKSINNSQPKIDDYRGH